MAIVPNRNRRTLTAIINQVLNANSIIHSDQWRAYINLPQFVQNCVGHETVNHTNHFVDPLTGAHTQVILILQNVKYSDFRKTLVLRFLFILENQFSLLTPLKISPLMVFSSTLLVSKTYSSNSAQGVYNVHLDFLIKICTIFLSNGTNLICHSLSSLVRKNMNFLNC